MPVTPDKYTDPGRKAKTFLDPFFALTALNLTILTFFIAGLSSTFRSTFRTDN